jgi:mono/diheme cytochrome c family protein
MKSRILSIVLALSLGLFINQITSANGKGHAETSRSHKHWSAPPEAAKRVNPVPRDKASIERGKKLYQTHCVVCHGSEGKGDGPAAAGLTPRSTNLLKMAGHHPDGDFAWKIANGRGAMPAWKDVLREHHIWDLTNFIKSLCH